MPPANRTETLVRNSNAGNGNEVRV
jgi:hypothetical protein